MIEKFTPEQRKQMAERIKTEAELIKGGAEYSEKGVLELTKEQIEAAKKEMERHFKRAKEKKERIRKEEEERKKEEEERKRREAFLKLEGPRKLREKLVEQIGDPREEYREEIISDLKEVFSLNKEEKDKMLWTINFPLSGDVAKKALTMDQNEAEVLLKSIKCPFSYEEIKRDPEILKKLEEMQNLPEIRKAQLRILLESFKNREFNDKFTEKDLDEFIDYNGDARKEGVLLFKWHDGIYKVFGKSTANITKEHIERWKKELIEKGKITVFLEPRDCPELLGNFARYLVLKAREHDPSEEMAVALGCNACAASWEEEIKNVFPSMKEDYLWIAESILKEGKKRDSKLIKNFTKEVKEATGRDIFQEQQRY